jgi:1,4-alpha-glucan branching enzyme
MATKVTFELAANIVADATEGILVGEFNNWDFTNGITLTKQKDGSLKTSLTLEPGKTYQYRYFLNDGRWVNDDRADNYNFVSEYQVDNCVVTVPVAEEKVKKATKAKAPKAEVAVEKKPKVTAKTKVATKAEVATPAPAKKEAATKTKKAAKK